MSERLTKSDVLLWIGQAIEGLRTSFRNSGCGVISGCSKTGELENYIGGMKSDLHNMQTAIASQDKKVEEIRRKQTTMEPMLLDLDGRMTGVKITADKTEKDNTEFKKEMRNNIRNDTTKLIFSLLGGVAAVNVATILIVAAVSNWLK